MVQAVQGKVPNVGAFEWPHEVGAIKKVEQGGGQRNQISLQTDTVLALGVKEIQ